MKSLKERLLSRTTTLALIVFILSAVLAASLIPQQFLTPSVEMESWRAAHPFLLPLVDWLRLHHVYTTPWFAGFILLATFSLLLSTIEQAKTAWRRTFAAQSGGDLRGIRVNGPVDDVAKTLREKWYLPIADGERLRFVKHPWGYWGNALLHAGMLVTIAASLFIALTDQRGMLYLTEGEAHAPDASSWTNEAHGMLAGPLVLPETVRLDRVTLRFSPDTTIDRVAGEISFLSGAGTTPEHVAINDILLHRGLRVYQGSEYGDAFTVQFTDAAGREHWEKLRLPHPPRIDKAGYEDFGVPWLPYGLSTKYYADAAGKAMDSPDRLLVLRFMEKEREIARIALRPGESGMLGNVRVKLIRIEKWSSLIFVNVTGMPAIFLGFCIMVLGGIIHYCTPPREFVAVGSGDGCLLSWKAARFKEFYQEEYRSVISAIEAGNT